MKSLFKADPWKVIEETFSPEQVRFTESIFSLANGHMGARGFFEEGYSGPSLKGTYIAGVFYPDKTKVGWWKIGYPEYFAKVANSPNWLGVEIEIDGQQLDLFTCKIENFRRELDMSEGKLTRSFTWLTNTEKRVRLSFTRFLSASDPNLAVVRVSATCETSACTLLVRPFIDGNVRNEDANYEEVFWDEVGRENDIEHTYLEMKTRKTEIAVAAAFGTEILVDGKRFQASPKPLERNAYVALELQIPISKDSTIEFTKFIAVATSRDFNQKQLKNITLARLQNGIKKGFDKLLNTHVSECARLWATSDISIEGDVSAQQGARYNIFQLNQNYNGKDPRLNIGPKGFTGEKYGGLTYWDTEAFCFPFYLWTKPEIAANLLSYRHLYLEQAKSNAKKLGLAGALFPMATIDGHECHNEWEITFEEIHRNGAIAYAIFAYARHTEDHLFLYEHGIEILVELSRFWASRVTENQRVSGYMILGVTGPNEYENNVNNNWYTNFVASWTLKYTLEVLVSLRENVPNRYRNLLKASDLNQLELEKWKDISKRMYFPVEPELGIFVQNDLFMDKKLEPASTIPADQRPIFKHWSWDRILRSCFLKQADVLQGLYLFREQFDLDQLRRNFEFYEPMTLHESSLSASVHSIIASWVGKREKAYELYLRTARLDLDNYNSDTEDGIHLTSMAGSSLAILQGFAGVELSAGTLKLAPYLPNTWKGYSFRFLFRGRQLKVSVNQDKVAISMETGDHLPLFVYGQKYLLQPSKLLSVPSIPGDNFAASY